MANIFYKTMQPLIFYKRILHIILTFVIGLVCFGFYLLFTPPGAKTALYLLSDLSGYKITFKTVEGNLTHHLKMTDLHFQGPAIDVEAEEIDLRWEFMTLFKKDKTLQSLKANHLKLNLKFEGALSEKPSLQELRESLAKVLPIPLQIDYVQINDAFLYMNGQAHEIKALTIKQASSQLSFEEIHYHGTFGSIEAYLQEAIKIKWNLTFTPPLFLEEYFTSDLVLTKGEILLPHRKIEDLENHINIHFKTSFLNAREQQLQNVDLTLTGTPTNHHFNLKAIVEDKPIDIALTGKLDSTAWQGKINSLTIKNKKWLDKGKITGSARINWQNENINALLELQLFEKYPLKVGANISKKKPYALSGTLQSHLKEVKTLEFLIPSLANVHGKLDLNLALSGNLYKPIYNGNLTLTEGSLKTGTFGSKIYLNRLGLTLNESNAIKINGEGTLGSGTFTLEGAGLLSDLNPTLSLKLKGKTLLLSDSPEFYIVADPDLTLTMTQGVPKLQGAIFVTKAEIQTLKNANAISPSSDVVILKAGQPQKASSPLRSSGLPPIQTDIEIILGNNITYKGHGLSTKVSGKLQLSQSPNELPLAKGKFTLHEGKYHAYGKQFDVRYGQILFTGGPIYDPILDIQAQRKVKSKTPSSFFKRNSKDSLDIQQTGDSRFKFKSAEDIVVGIKLTGNVKSPRLDFFSSPAMAEADILSYLVVGRPQSEISDAQAEILFQAATQLAGVLSKSGNAPNLNILSQLKLDQFGLSKKPETFTATPNSSGNKNMLEDTVFVLGKQLSDRLYLHYSVGILDSASNFGLRYSLGKNLMLEATTGSEGSSADVLLSFEGR